jgi:hypothetical protein
MGNATDTTSRTNQNTTNTSNSLTNFLNTMAKQYASNTSQNTATTQTYSPSEYAKSLLAGATAPITSEQLSQYQSPYQQQVIDATMAQLESQYGKQQSALTGNTISMNALGGDRAKLAQAALMGEQGRNTASTLAGLEQQGYQTALSAAQADRARQIQAAGLSGGTTTGGSSMTGATTGREAGYNQGSASSSQYGTSATTGYNTTDTRSNPTIFGGNLGFIADGGAIRKREDGGGIPSWAMPPPMQQAPLLQPAESKPGKTMSTKDMVKLGDKARTQLTKIFSSEDKAGSFGGGQGGGLFDQSGSVAGGMGDTASATAGASEATSAATEAATAAEAAGASEAATAGAGEAAGALGKGAAGAGEAAAGAGEGMGSMMALLALLADGGAVRRREDGGGMDSTPGISMERGIGQEWFKVPTINPTEGIKGSSAANGGEISHRDAGGTVNSGVTVAPARATMPELQPMSTTRPSVSMPQFPTNQNNTSNGKGSSSPGYKFSQQGLSDLFSGSSNGKGSGSTGGVNGYLSSLGMADGGVVRRRADGGENDQEAPSFIIEQERQLEEARKAREALAAKEVADVSGEQGPSEPAPVQSGLSKLGDLISSYSRPISGGLSKREIDAQLEAEKAASTQTPPAEAAKPNISDLALKPFDTSVEPVPIKMKGVVPIDAETGKDIVEAAPPAPERNPGIGSLANAEPGAEEIAPDKPKNHAQAVVETLRANGASDSFIRGVLANVQNESGFNPGLVGKGDQRGRFKGDANNSHGLYQFGGEEWSKYVAWIDKDHPGADWKDPALQTQYLVNELKANRLDVWKKMQKASPEEAAQIFLHKYENPAKQHADKRHEQYGRGVLSIEDYTSIPSSVTTSERPASIVKAGEGAKSLAALAPLVEKAKDPNAPAMAGATSGPPPQEGGNILSRILESGFNPLKLSDKDLSFMAQTALGGLGGINKAVESAQGARGQDIQAQQHAVQMAMEAQKLQHMLAQPTVMGEGYDPSTGIWHKQYGAFDPRTNKYVPSMPSANSANSGVTAGLDSIPQDVTGKEFVDRAKKLGYSGNVMSTAQSVADYKADPSKLLSMKGEQREIVNRLAQRINPDYDMTKYAAVADSEKKLASGDVAKSLRSVGRLFDEVEQAHSLADATGNTRSENANRAFGEVYSSGSNYGVSRAKLGLSLNNVSNSASSVAKGGGSGAEGDAKRRLESMNVNQAPEALKGALKVEAETGLKIGQTNLESYNSAHGYTPDNPKYKTVMDYMTPAQQQKAIKLLGPDKIEEITGKPVKGASQDRPIGVSRVQAATQGQQSVETIPIAPDLSVPAPALGALMKNPKLSTEFDAKYGKGASQKALSLFHGA